MQYDDSQHVHLGYYDQGYDLEATAFKVVDQKLWHVFFPFESYGLQVPCEFENSLRQAEFGTLIFTVTEREKLQKTFTHWVEEKLFPLFGTGRSVPF